MAHTPSRFALIGAALIATQATAQQTGGANPRGVPAEQEIVARLARTMDSLVARGEFSGVVLLARRAAPVFEHAYGYADRERKLPNTPETAFNLGSINKMFTATAVRQLVAAGKLSLDSTVATYWPDYPNARAAHQVTIRQLMEHRGGLGGNIFGEPAHGSRHDIRHNRDFVQLFAAESLAFVPGTRQAYSNAGYVVLGNIVERASGEDYYDYVRKHIYEPAGLTHTAHYAIDSLPANVAIGYMSHNERGDPIATHPNSELLPGRGSSAGGGYSTARDL
ncbi:MAG: serine hydrolase domain-containing protein, partial [Gemmatimonadaceae bacterium]